MRLFAATLCLAFGLSAGAAGQEAADCGQAYKGMLSAIERKKPRLSAEAQLVLERTALRLYHACETGHLEQPGELFKKLDRTRS
jgi:hypothetical protein